MSLHAHSPYVNAVCTRPPVHSAAVPVSTTIGAPPPTHFAGSGPTGTAGTQSPSTQPIPVEHALPQAPQCALSLSVSTQVCAHSLSGAGQLSAQPFDRHTCCAPHATLHAPQFWGSTCVLTQVPLHRSSP